VFHRQIQSAIDEGRLIFENCFRTGGGGHEVDEKQPL
jgi:hypothetical protein